MIAILSGADGSVIRSIFGDAQDDEIGTDIAGVPDVDGDGVDNLVAVSFPGVARVYSTATGATLRTTSAADTLERYSWCVERLSDLNSDAWARLSLRD